MDVTLAVLADAANITEDGKLNLLGVFNEISAEDFPCRHPQMYCVVMFEAGPAEFNKKKVVEIAIVRPDGEVLGKLEADDVTVPKPAGKRTRSYVRMILNLQNVPFPEPGDYELSVLVGGEQKRSIPLTVMRDGGRE